MALTTFFAKQNDAEPKLVATLQNADGSAIDLTTATTVKFIMRGVANPQTVKVNTACTVVSAAAGIVRYAWAADGSDLNTIGVYDAEFEIDWSGRKQTIPNVGYNSVVVADDLG